MTHFLFCSLGTGLVLSAMLLWLDARETRRAAQRRRAISLVTYFLTHDGDVVYPTEGDTFIEATIAAAREGAELLAEERSEQCD